MMRLHYEIAIESCWLLPDRSEYARGYSSGGAARKRCAKQELVDVAFILKRFTPVGWAHAKTLLKVLAKCHR